MTQSSTHLQSEIDHLRSELSRINQEFVPLFEEMTSGFAYHKMIYNQKGEPSDYLFIKVNKAFEELTGFKDAEIAGKTVLEVIPTLEKVWIDNYGKVAMTGKPCKFENYVKEMDKYFEVKAFSPHKDYFAVIFTDITTYVKIAQELAKSQHLYNSIIENAQDLIWKCDNNGNFIFLNKACEKIYGYTANEMLGKPFTDFMNKENAERDTALFQELLSKNGNITGYETVHVNKNGNPVYLSFNAVFYKDKDGKIIGTQGTARDITEQITTENTLKESETRYKLVTEKSPVALFLHRNGRFLYLNPAALSMLHAKSADELLGKPILESVHPDWRAKVVERVRVAFEEKAQPPVIDEKFICVDGTPIDVQAQGVTVEYQGQSTMLVFAQDITDRKKVEQALQESEMQFKQQNEEYEVINEELKDSYSQITAINEELRKAKEIAENNFNYKKSILEAIPDLMFVFDENGKFLDYNAPQQTDLYAPPEFFIGRSLHEVMPPDIADLANSKIKMVLATKNAEIFNYQLNLHDIFSHWEMRMVYLTESTVLSLSRNITNLENLINDIKVAKEKIEESEEKYRGIVTSSPALIIITNPSGIVTYISPQASDVVGYPSEQFIGKIFPDIIHPDDVQICRDKWMEMFENNGNLQNFEYRVIDKKNETRWVSHSTNWLKTGDKLLGLQNTILNITEKKNTEIELRNAKEKAEESDRLKSAFLANMSHEIRTPMNGIIGFTDLINDSDISDTKRKHYSEIIRDSCMQLLNIVNDIIDISKIEAGLVEIKAHELNINDLIIELFSFYTPVSKKNNINMFINKTLNDKEALIITDDVKLKQIINNLISNAVKFTHKGFIEFGYNLKNNELEFFVKDTGIGIPHDQKQLIFERFRQASGSKSTQYGGTGLGLAIARAYTEKLGGKIWLTSEVDKGSTFYFTIPYNPVNKSIDNQENQPEAIVINLKTILVVEDEEINYLYLEEVLKKLNYRVLHAKNGAETLELISKHPEIELVLLDIKLPDTNGYDLAKHIALINNEIPIIAQTAYAMSGDREKALQAGCKDYIAKPIMKNKLIELIKKYL